MVNFSKFKSNADFRFSFLLGSYLHGVATVFRDHDNEHIAVQLVGRERFLIHMTLPDPTSNV